LRHGAAVRDRIVISVHGVRELEHLRMGPQSNTSKTFNPPNAIFSYDQRSTT
jgi:hypothetical protein